MLWQPMHPKSNIILLLFFSSFCIALCFFLENRFRVTNKNLKILFDPSLGSLDSADQIGKLIFGKLILTRFWGVLCQPVHPESNIRLSRSFSLFDSPPTFFPKTGLQVRMSNFKTILAPFLGSFPVSRQDLVNLYWPDFGVCSANQCTQNQI